MCAVLTSSYNPTGTRRRHIFLSLGPRWGDVIAHYNMHFVCFLVARIRWRKIISPPAHFDALFFVIFAVAFFVTLHSFRLFRIVLVQFELRRAIQKAHNNTAENASCRLSNFIDYGQSDKHMWHMSSKCARDRFEESISYIPYGRVSH